MLRQSMLIKKRSDLEKRLTTLRTKQRQLRASEEQLQAQVEEIEEITPELEAQVNDLSTQQTAVEDELTEVLDQLDEVKAELETLGAGGEPAAEPAPAGTGARSVAAGNFRSRSGVFTSRSSMRDFYSQRSVKEFIGRVRSLASAAANGSRRNVTGADLAIPTEVLEVIRDNLGEHSKLLKHVRLRPLKGKGRALVAGKVPEGIWTEMCGRLNELPFTFTGLELDGYKVGGFIPICRALLADATDVDLGEEIMDSLLRSIGIAVDKAIVFGLGRNKKMPEGFVTRLAQTQQPGDWDETRGQWTDLHSTNVLQLNLTAVDGVAYYRPLLAAMGKANPDYTNGQTVWVMNRATHMEMKAAGLAFNAAGALVAALDGTVPVEGGIIEELEFMPDGMVAGGFMDAYLLVEREGGTVESSDHVMFIEDMRVFKATARYDGAPIAGEAFVAFTVNNTAPTTAVSFTDDRANEPLNALVISAATVKSGKVTATISGAKGSAPIYAVKATAATVDIHGNDVVVPGEGGWAKYTASVAVAGAAADQTLHVVELDEDGHIVSAGTAKLTAG